MPEHLEGHLRLLSVRRGFVATETLVFLILFLIFYVSSKRSDAFYSAVERTVEPKLPTARRLLNHLTIASCGVGLPQ